MNRLSNQSIRPLRRQVGQVQFGPIPGAPVERDRPGDVVVDGMLDQSLDRCETGTAGHHDDRLLRSLAQMERAERPLEAQDVLQLHGREDMVGEVAARHVAQVQIDDVVLVRRVGHREGAALAVGQQELDVLARQKLQALVARQLESEHHDIVRQSTQFLHPAGHGPDRDVLLAGDLMHFEHEIAERLGATSQHHAGCAVGVGQRRRIRRALMNLTGNDLAFAGAAGAIPAAVGQVQAGIQG